MDEELKALYERISADIADYIHAEGLRLFADKHPIAEIQPPASVALLAGQAAASVLMGFERGFRMVEEQEKTA